MKLQEDDLWNIWKVNIKKFFNNHKVKIKKPKVIIKKILRIDKLETVIDSISLKKFPCEGCLVYPGGCRELCDKVEMDNKKLKELFLKYNACPDCGSEQLYEGPSGGMCTNVTCAGCGHRFNLGLPVFIERI
jgi:hypothetical protein